MSYQKKYVSLPTEWQTCLRPAHIVVGNKEEIFIHLIANEHHGSNNYK
jgi:hypothetical protein